MTEAQPGTWRRVAVVHNLLDLVWDEPLSVGEAASLAASDLPEAVAAWKESGVGGTAAAMRAAIGHGWTMETSSSSGWGGGGAGARRRVAGFGQSVRSEPGPTFSVLGIDWDLEVEAVFLPGGESGRESPAVDALMASGPGQAMAALTLEGTPPSSPRIPIPGSPAALVGASPGAGGGGRDSPTWGSVAGFSAQSPSPRYPASGPDVRLTFRPWSLGLMSSSAGSPSGGSWTHQLTRGSPGSRGRGGMSRSGGGGMYVFKVYHLFPGGASTPALQEPTGSVPTRGARLRSSYAHELLAHRRIGPGASHKVLLLAELQATTAQMLEMRGL